MAFLYDAVRAVVSTLIPADESSGHKAQTVAGMPLATANKHHSISEETLTRYATKNGIHFVMYEN